MKNVLVFGINGMLGECLYTYLGKQPNINLYGTSRENFNTNIFSFDLSYENILVQLDNIFTGIKFDYVVNCIVNINKNNQLNEIELLINSVFPQILKFYAEKYNFKLIQISTNGVFEGLKGNYEFDDIPNNLNSSYGVTKILGEVIDNKNLTIRTSIIGIERETKGKGLLNWLLSQKKGTEIYGYTNVFWNGVTTLTLSKIIYNIINKDLKLNGVLQICGEKYSKYELLNIISDIFNLNIFIKKDISKKQDITLKSNEVFFTENKIPIDKQLVELKEFYNKTSS